LAEAGPHALSTFTGADEKTGEKIQTAITAPFTIEQFYRFIQEKRLMAAKCKECGSTFIPPRPMCTNCLSKKLIWVQLKPRGKLLTYTVIHVAPERFQSMAPYAYGVIELDEGPRLPGIVKGVDLEKIEVGIELVVDFETELAANWPQWPRYYFRPP